MIITIRINDYQLIIDIWFHIWYQLIMISGLKIIEQKMLWLVPESNRKSERHALL